MEPTTEQSPVSVEQENKPKRSRFFTFLQKLGKIITWILATSIIGFLVSFMNIVINNRFGEGDSAGWAVIIYPFVILFLLLTTLPFVIKTFYHLFANGKTKCAVASIVAIIFTYSGFFISCVWNVSLKWEDSLVVSGSLMCLFGIALFAFMIYGLMDARHVFIALFLAIAIVSVFVIPTMIRSMHDLVKSKKSISVSYGEPFDPTSFQEYMFPDFTLKPNLQLRVYTIVRNDNHKDAVA